MLFTINKLKELYTKNNHFLILLQSNSIADDTWDYNSMLIAVNTKLKEIESLDFGEYLPHKKYKDKKLGDNLVDGIYKFEKPIRVNISESPKNGIFIDLACLGYNKKTDSVHFSFEGNTKKGIGIDLGKGVVIRIDSKTKEWLGVSIFGISKLLKVD